jgi:hypothetical protein
MKQDTDKMFDTLLFYTYIEPQQFLLVTRIHRAKVTFDNTPSVPIYKDVEGSNFVPKYKVMKGYDKIE